MNHPPFVWQLDTKYTLKLTPLADTYFLALLLPKALAKVPINLLVYAKVTHPMQSRGHEILLWLQTGVLLKTGILLLTHLQYSLGKRPTHIKVNAHTMF